MHVPMTAFSTEVTTRIWMLAPYAVHCITRSGKMNMRIYRGSVQRREFLPRSRGTRNTTFKRLFRNKENAKLLRWYKEEHKQDSMSRHLADGSQWRKIDRTYMDFASDAKNIRHKIWFEYKRHESFRTAYICVPICTVNIKDKYYINKYV